MTSMQLLQLGHRPTLSGRCPEATRFSAGAGDAPQPAGTNFHRWSAVPLSVQCRATAPDAVDYCASGSSKAHGVKPIASRQVVRVPARPLLVELLL